MLDETLIYQEVLDKLNKIRPVAPDEKALRLAQIIKQTLNAGIFLTQAGIIFYFIKNKSLPISQLYDYFDKQTITYVRDALNVFDFLKSYQPKLEKLLRSLKSGDVLTVWRLDRLGRSLPHLIEVVRNLEGKGAGFQSLSEDINTTTAGGRLVFHLMGALAEFERSLIVERTQAGLQAARKRGVPVGRPRSLTPAQVKHARKLIDSGERPAAVSKSLGVNRSTLYRHLNQTAKI